MQRGHPAARAARSEEGFTLLELMMVILIIAILIAVLMPVFAGASSRAKDRAMQTNLSTAVKAAKVSYNEKLDYTQVGLGTLTADSGSLNFVAGGVVPDTQSAVSVDLVNESYIVISGQSKAGDCFYVSDDESTGSTLYARLGGAGGCAANGAPLPNDPAWQAEW
jgi:prepilin-type N-terminal cleavage/methylation domain-containing protein